ncbi:MAG: pectin acetylesterase-family hydrolase [Pseudomonas sp.]|uniref:pectin acetylesterase-family hydrolase n=1 Tax=Pseudomonas sp. TaxID=306 RepID=UPI003399E4C9
MPVTTRVLCLLAPMLVGVAAPASAELGDYSFWQTLKHLVSPPGPDNPVTPAQRLGPYPLLANPPGFDGFTANRHYAWQRVQLAPQTGAVCGNGSPYKFFVNRVPNSSNTLIYLEGGGACWDHASCSGQTGIRGARNPQGIADNYMSLLNPGASLVSPFVVRLHPWTRVKTQNWNLVYVPYCTGDTYAGDKVAIYPNPQSPQAPLVWHHNGLRNLRAVTGWLKDHLPRPGQLLNTGCSAGGAGSLMHHAALRQDLAPSRGYLLDDSGPVFGAPVGGSSRDYPSLPLQTHIRQAWGLDAGPLAYLQSRLPGLNLHDLGSIYAALSSHFPADRMGHTHFWQDLNYSSYSYERFDPEIIAAPDRATKTGLIHARWAIDTQRLRNGLASLPNMGGYFPQYRGVNESHCTAIIEFANADIQEQNLQLDQFVSSLLDGSGPVLQASESSDLADRQKPFNLLYYLLDQLL